MSSLLIRAHFLFYFWVFPILSSQKINNPFNVSEHKKNPGYCGPDFFAKSHFCNSNLSSCLFFEGGSTFSPSPDVETISRQIKQ